MPAPLKHLWGLSLGKLADARRLQRGSERPRSSSTAVSRWTFVHPSTVQHLTTLRSRASRKIRSWHLDGILAYCHEKIPFGKVEAINPNIRAVLRRGRSYPDHE